MIDRTALDLRLDEHRRRLARIERGGVASAAARRPWRAALAAFRRGLVGRPAAQVTVACGGPPPCPDGVLPAPEV